MGKLVNSFIEPYPMEALGGQLGLSSVDIARALGVDVSDIHRKIKRGTWTQNSEWLTMLYDIYNENNRLVTYYAFNVNGAKAFVARWANNKG